MAESTFRVGEQIGQYKVLDATNPALVDPTAKATAIGKGASAEVCLVEQTLTAGVTINRALKYYAPNSKILERRQQAGFSEGQESFLAEIKSISSFNHQNLVKVIDAGRHQKQPYFVMEYVDGLPLLDLLDPKNPKYEIWAAKAKEDPFLVLRMARQLCWPIAYLHSFRFFHFDIAPKNIFIREVGDKPHLILGDLGVGQTVPPVDSPGLTSMGGIFIGGTREYTPEVLHEYLNYKEGKLAPPELLSKFAQYWDVFAIAVVLEEMIEKWSLSSNRDLEATKILCRRAKNFDEGFDALRLTNELERLLPAQVLTAGVEELSNDAVGKRTYVAIPLYSVPISERIEEVISHPAYVRLQKVPQFLLGRTVFPGGVHSRYEHALGAYGLGQRYLIKLLANPQFRADFSRKELEEALLSVLLSKLVSFVFDYAFFDLFLTNDPEKDATSRELRLNLFLGLKAHADQKSLREVIEHRFPGADIDLVIKILSGKPPKTSRQAQLIAGIVKSSIDARVLDYLPRDSHHTSIPAGHGIDINQIIDSLTWSAETGSIGITRMGVFSVEHLLCARYWMYNRVYWNSINRALAAMIRYIMQATIKAGNLDENHFVREVMHLDEPSALHWLDQNWNSTAGDGYKYSSILPLLQQARPRPYRLVLELSGKTWSEHYINSARGMTPEALEKGRIRFIETCSLSTKLKRGDVLFDIPRDKALKLGDDIRVQTGKNSSERLIDASEIVRVLPKAFLETAFKFRVFVNPEINLSTAERNALGTEAREFLEIELK